MSDIKSYKDVYDYHGWREQNKHFISEAYELAEAIHNYQVYDSVNNLNHVTEEVADIFFMLNEIIEAYDIDIDNVDDWLEYKRKRESKRIEEGYYERLRVSKE